MPMPGGSGRDNILFHNFTSNSMSMADHAAPDDDETARLALLLYSHMMKNETDKESDADSSSPPRALQEPGFGMVPAPYQYHTFTTNMESSSSSSSSSSYANYPPSVYSTQTRQEDSLYCLDPLPSPPQPQASSHHGPPTAGPPTVAATVTRPPYNNSKENVPPGLYVTNQHHPMFNITGNPHKERSGLDYRRSASAATVGAAAVEAPYYPPIHKGTAYGIHATAGRKDPHLRETSPSCSPPAYEALRRENLRLREQLKEREYYVSSLQLQLYDLENQIVELRQLPTGKISQIPIDDMICIMQEYGSEVSEQTMSNQRKTTIKKASIIRQFRRWNPEFFQFFVHVNGKWVPKLGKEGELRRRKEKRQMIKNQQQNNKVR